MKKLLLIAFLALSLPSFSQKKISSAEAANHVGDSVLICEKVYGGRFLEAAEITFLNMGAQYPYQLFAVVIKGEDRAKFAFKPEAEFQDKTICVSGKVQLHRGKPQLIVVDPKQITVSNQVVP
ncbi:hypothetical protein [Pedobacter sp. SYSU D00535]|uniref:hypothetical protein n=1 Tax=Pedobacter sp. SYSU D00535 TaxID=2810308 RepID=UPI001A9681B9|nr:hypothetical protein [Pedobacter sp. SYSU D00535]